MHRFGKGIPLIVILKYLKQRKVNSIFLLEQSKIRKSGKSRKNGIPVYGLSGQSGPNYEL